MGEGSLQQNCSLNHKPSADCALMNVCSNLAVIRLVVFGLFSGNFIDITNFFLAGQWCFGSSLVY